jgi:hypothetical protein
MLNLKGNKMLMVDQFHALSVKEQASTLKAFRAIYLEKRANLKFAREAAKVDKAQAKALKQEQAILKAQLRLQKLLEKQAAPVGSKAIKANKRPSKVVTYGAEDNAIAEAIMARKATA